MKTAVINIKTDSKLKLEAQKTASEMGLTLTVVINRYLKNFVESKTISFGTSSENEKSPYGIFSGVEISEREINAVKKSWQKGLLS